MFPLARIVRADNLSVLVAVGFKLASISRHLHNFFFVKCQRTFVHRIAKAVRDVSFAAHFQDVAVFGFINLN